MSIETLNKYIQENRVIRGKWTDIDKEGRETACLLAALSPEVANSQDPSKCPANLMPEWMAHLTPFIDDSGSIEKWPHVIRRYADLASRWHVLSSEAWARAGYRVRRVSLIEAMGHTKDEKVLAVCSNVLKLLDRAMAGDFPAEQEWKAAEAAAEAAATAAEAWAAEAAAAAADRIIDGIFEVLEDEIKGAKEK